MTQQITPTGFAVTMQRATPTATGSSVVAAAPVSACEITIPPVVVPPCTVRADLGVAADLLDGANADQTLPSQRLAVTTDGTYIVAGDTGYAAGGGDTGIVHVFKNDGGWTEVATLSPPSGGYDRFGWCVSIADDLTIVAGAQGSGAWYAFAATGGDTWAAGVSVATATQLSGLRINRGGTVVVVSDVGGTTDVFVGAGASWSFAQTLSPAHGGDYSGVAIAGDGKTIAANNDAGAQAWVDAYTSSDLTFWRLAGTIQLGPLDGTGGGSVHGGSFNQVAVADDGATIVAGSDDAISATSTTVGALYVIAKGDDGYAISATLLGEDAISGFGFAAAIALSSDGQFLVSGFQNAISPDFDGRVVALNCVQRQSAKGRWELAGATLANPHSGTTGFRFGGAVAMNGDGSLVAAMGIDFPETGLSTLRVFSA